MSEHLGFYLAAAFTLAFLVIWRIQNRPSLAKDPEPPLVRPIFPVPLLGHAIGLLTQRTGYYVNLSKICKLPIFSISMFGGKVHVVGSPELMHSLHRQPNVVSFWFMEANFTVQLGAMSQEAGDALKGNLGPHDNGSSLLIEGLKSTQRAMSPQGGVEDMIKSAAAVTKSRLNDIRASQGASSVNLWDWIQHEITMITTESVYGKANPYRDPQVESGFWDFTDDTIMLLLPGILPKLLARKGLAGRETVVHRMREYFSSEAYMDASPLTKARYAALKGNIPDDDLARFECVNGIAILANSVPTAFWGAYHIFSDPVVLKQVRSQVEAITTTIPAAEGGRKVRKINLTRLKDAPIIFSVLQEALRLRATGTGPRMLMDDAVVGPDQYHLQKGSVLIIANKALHFDQEAWGENAEQFVADRFCAKTPGYAFRGFGGGLNLCPGKGFAMAEIGAFLAMLAMRFDVVPEIGKWEEPGQDLTNMSLQIAPPRKKTVVNLVSRHHGAEEDDAQWEFEF